MMIFMLNVFCYLYVIIMWEYYEVCMFLCYRCEYIGKRLSKYVVVNYKYVN